MNKLLKNIITLAAAIVPLSCTQKQEATVSTDSMDMSVYEGLPFEMSEVEQPLFPDYSVSIIDFGAVADGKTLNTEAINNAIKDVNGKGGGKVIIPAGLWMTGPIELLSNVNLYTE